MDPSLIESSLSSAEVRQHRAAGEMLFLEGELPVGVYVLHAGAVELLFASRNGDAKVLRVATPCQILGLSSVVMQVPHDCSATARVACEIGFIRSDDFLRYLQEQPEVWSGVLRLLSSDVHAAYDDMRALAAG